jgi:hypothetical protein
MSMVQSLDEDELLDEGVLVSLFDDELDESDEEESDEPDDPEDDSEDVDDDDEAESLDDVPAAALDFFLPARLSVL